MNNQITLAYLDYDDLDALQVVSVVSFYESFIDGADPLDMQGYLQTQLTTEILAVELAQSTSKFIGIKDHQILIGYMKVNDEKDAIEIQRIYLLKDYQNKGLGQRLLDEANRSAKTKQKRYLRSLAATMPPVVQIGKNGLENSVIDSARVALMARELIKVKLHNNSPEDKTIFQELADMLGAELVQVIGFNGVLYKAKKEPKIILPK